MSKVTKLLLALTTVFTTAMPAMAADYVLWGCIHNNDQIWDDRDDLKFQASGDGYYKLHVDRIWERFKIVEKGNSKVQYGAETYDDNGSKKRKNIATGETVRAVNDGATGGNDFYPAFGATLEDVDITFNPQKGTIRVDAKKVTDNPERVVWAITGDSFGWNLDNKLSRQNDGSYTIDRDNLSGKIKFVKYDPTQGLNYWTHQWGKDGDAAIVCGHEYTALNISENPDNKDIELDGMEMNLKGVKITLRQDGGGAPARVTLTANSFYENKAVYAFVGNFNEWNTENNKFTYNNDGSYTLRLDELDREFKVVKYWDGFAGSAWERQWGKTGDDMVANNKDYDMTYGETNLGLGGLNTKFKDVTVTVTPGFGNRMKLKITAKEAEYHEDVYCLTGTLNDWKVGADTYMFKKQADGKWKLTIDKMYGDFKILKYETGKDAENKQESWYNQWCSTQENGTVIDIKRNEWYEATYQRQVGSDCDRFPEKGGEMRLDGTNPEYRNVTITLEEYTKSDNSKGLKVLVECSDDDAIDLGETWYLCGSEPLKWTIYDSPRFTKESDGVWRLHYQGEIPAGTHFKLVNNGRWANSHVFTAENMKNEEHYTDSDGNDKIHNLYNFTAGNWWPLEGPKLHDMSDMKAADTNAWKNPVFELAANDIEGSDHSANPMKLRIPLDNTSAIDDINTDETTDIIPVYYDLQGRQVENPVSGLYIVVRGSKVTKEIVK